MLSAQIFGEIGHGTKTSQAFSRPVQHETKDIYSLGFAGRNMLQASRSRPSGMLSEEPSVFVLAVSTGKQWYSL